MVEMHGKKHADLHGKCMFCCPTLIKLGMWWQILVELSNVKFQDLAFRKFSGCCMWTDKQICKKICAFLYLFTTNMPEIKVRITILWIGFKMGAYWMNRNMRGLESRREAFLKLNHNLGKNLIWNERTIKFFLQ
jgi:hypothetical protein